MYWKAYLKHLQTIFRKFDANAVILELVLIRLFCNSLKSFIRPQAKQKSCWKNIWNQIIKKAIMVEIKAALNLSL